MHFRIACLNTHSCRNKTDDVQDLVKEHNIDLMCITESWLREQGDEPIIAAITPPGYTVKSYPRKDRTGGGRAFIFPSNDSSNYVINTSTSTHESFEAASANLKSSSFSCHILCVYRPPRSKKNCATNEFFLNEFRDVVQTLRKKYTRFMIVDILGYRKVSARWRPRMLTDEMKMQRKTTCAELLEHYKEEGEEFIQRIVTGDESWVHHHDPESKRQSMEYRHKSSPSPRKLKVVASARKVMLTVFWDSNHKVSFGNI
ncbi:histone-lysine N-methyltransferase SETMAR [Elysia marginata]|uniref:Histone-lysine N-methyltransferase SETMAR n=1 Tax=Elysia marginata TaxID=1093978 RepID=A0AAV4HC35_9GAST|nr:histone-lysine N-methyltransferase SETMAR [Elysia marginata]